LSIHFTHLMYLWFTKGKANDKGILYK
jgi:hypothetical protein